MKVKMIFCFWAVLYFIGCRSTTPMSGVSSVQGNQKGVNTGISVTLTEATDQMAGEQPKDDKEINLCLFGKNLDELANLGEFELEKRGTVERMGVTKNLENRNLLFAFTEYHHKKTGVKYSVFNTFLKSIDGGITRGWIQTSLSQEIVAEIDDGEIQNCKILKNPAPVSAVNETESSCLFGFEVTSLIESPKFKIVEDKELFKNSRIPGEIKKRQKYRQIKLRINNDKKNEYQMLLRLSEIQGSNNFNGWIEEADSSSSGRILALIGESEIYECVVDGSGAMIGFIQENTNQCLFGKEYLDVEMSPDFSVSSQTSEILTAHKVRRTLKPMMYQRRIITHKPSGKSFVLFNTFRDEDDSGKTMGWIESIEGRVVAEIFESSFRNCHL